MGLLSKVNRLIHSKLDDLTDRDIFLSDQFKAYIEAFLEIFARDHGRRVTLRIVDDPNLTAATDGSNIYVSVTSNFLAHHPSRVQRADAIKGLCAHEIGHVLFTDFVVGSSAAERMLLGQWYPAAPYRATDSCIEATYCAEMETMMSNEHPAVRKKMSDIWFSINNAVEDAYIEMRMCDRYPGFARYIATKNVIHYDTLPMLDELDEDAEKCSNPVEKAQRKFSIFFAGVAGYAKLGVVKMREGYMSPVIESIFSCISDVDSCIVNSDAYNRIEKTNRIFVASWPYIKDILEEVSKQQPQQGQDSDAAEDALARALSKALSEMAKGSSSNAPRNRNSKPIDGKTNDAQNARKGATGNASATLHVSASGNSSDNGQSGADAGANAQQGNNSSGDGASNSGGNTPSGSTSGNKGASNSGGTAPSGSTSGNKGAGNSGGNTPSGSTPGNKGASNSGGNTPSAGNGSNHPTMPEPSDDGVIDKMAKEIARQLAEEEVAAEQLSSLQAEMRDDSHGSVTVTRPVHVTPQMRQSYRRTAEGRNGGENLIAISKKLQRQMMSILKNQIEGGKMTRLPIGNKISTKDLIRDDPFFFTKMKAPQDKADLAVCVLVDESGSMGGANIKAAIDTSIILEDFLRNMQIPCCIYGHTTGYGGCELRCYQEFEHTDNNDRYRIMEMAPRGGTPTATALNACYKRIQKRQEASKLIIVITDGEPGDNGNQQIQKLIRESHRHGIEIFGVGIAGAASSLERIYSGRTIAIDDLNELPKRMVRLVKRYIRFV